MHSRDNRVRLAVMLAFAMTFVANLALSSPDSKNSDLEALAPVAAEALGPFARFESWIRGAVAKFTGRCDVADVQISLSNIKCLEARRSHLNGSQGSLAGDRELIYRMLIFARSDEASPDAEATVNLWTNPSPEIATIENWNDQKYLYRYMAHLKRQANPNLNSAQPPIVPKRALTTPDDFAKAMKAVEDRYGTPLESSFSAQEFFSETSEVAIRPKSRLGANVMLNALMYQAREIGFLIENSGAAVDFTFDANGIDLVELESSLVRGRPVVADLPGPMHADGERLIELGVANGRIFNLLTGGGSRRSGIVVLTPDGRAFPFHVQAIDPSVWGSKATGRLDLSNSVRDLVTFLQIAKAEKLSVFMEMLLGEQRGDETGLTPIKNPATARSARLLVWKSQRDGKPSILFLNDGIGKNHAVWVAHRLGYNWVVNVDAYFIDQARYFNSTAEGRVPTDFGTPIRGLPSKPWSRIVFRDFPSK